MTTQATEQPQEYTSELVKFLTPSKNPQFTGQPTPPATLALGESGGEKIVAIWLGDFGESHNDPDAEFVAIQREPESIDEVSTLAQVMMLAALIEEPLLFAPTAKLREAGFTFYTLVPAQESNAQVA